MARNVKILLNYINVYADMCFGEKLNKLYLTLSFPGTVAMCSKIGFSILKYGGGSSGRNSEPPSLLEINSSWNQIVSPHISKCAINNHQPLQELNFHLNNTFY